MHYSADEFEFCACTQEEDGMLQSPSGTGWILVQVDPAQVDGSAVLIATWMRPRNPPQPEPECPGA